MNEKLRKRYYEPLIQRFAEAELRSGAVAVDDLLRWYSTFKRAYTSIANLKRVLSHVGYPGTDVFFEKINAQAGTDACFADLYKRCVALGYSETMRCMKEFVEKILSKRIVSEKVRVQESSAEQRKAVSVNEKPVPLAEQLSLLRESQLSYEDAESLVMHAVDRYTYVANKIIVLEVLGCVHAPQLRRVMVERDQKTEFLRDIHVHTHIRMGCIREMDDALQPGGLAQIARDSLAALIRKARTYKYRGKLMTVFRYLIRDTDTILDLESHLDYRYTKLNKVEYFFRARPSHVLKGWFDDVLEKHEHRLKSSSAYEKERLKDLELRIVSFLAFVDQYQSGLSCQSETSDPISSQPIPAHPTPAQPESSQLEPDSDPIVSFFQVCTPVDVHRLLVAFGRSCRYDNQRVKSKLGKHHQAAGPLLAAITFLKYLVDDAARAHTMASVCSGIDATSNAQCPGRISERESFAVACGAYVRTLKVSSILVHVENKSELLDWDKRRVYTDSEVQAMLDACTTTKDRLMITILREIGLRNAAICNLRFGDIVDRFLAPKNPCRVREKGNKIREFITTVQNGRLIVSYIHELEVEGIVDTRAESFLYLYVFSRARDLKTKMASSTLNHVLKRIAVLGGVTDVNVQAHTFRHTLVGKLIDAGNSLETVSKFIGHSSVDTTMTYYWLKNITDLANEIRNPFLAGSMPSNDEEEDAEEKMSEIELLNKKIDTLFQILGVYRTTIQDAADLPALQSALRYHEVHINKVLRFIADSDTSSVRTT